MKDYYGYTKKSMYFKGTLQQITQECQRINDSENMITEAMWTPFFIGESTKGDREITKGGKIIGVTEKYRIYEVIINYKIKDNGQFPANNKATSEDVKQLESEKKEEVKQELKVRI